MKATPDQHDPDWPKYPETVLHFAGDPKLELDLRAVMTPHGVAGLERIGLCGPFAVMTAFDPRGENLSPEENDRRAAELDRRLREKRVDFIRVDACSPGGEHCECSVAVKMPREDAVQLAKEFEQVAIFWFDGEQFWVVGALLQTDPVMLPRSS